MWPATQRAVAGAGTSRISCASASRSAASTAPALRARVAIAQRPAGTFAGSFVPTPSSADSLATQLKGEFGVQARTEDDTKWIVWNDPLTAPTRPFIRSETRRVGKEWDGTWRTRLWTKN